MELLANTKIDFMKYARVFVPASVVLVLASTALLAVNDDSDGNWNARITRSLPVGAYFLYVTHYSATGTGAYEIRVRTGA